ncbi:MAG: hypothetical protein LBT16_08495 [Treponema sp.]|jgi:hypothetical protein|nr:hypothetical protein [Treponema sp.]
MKTAAFSFLQAILGFFFRKNTPETIRKRGIRTIAKRIKYEGQQFYLPETKELTLGCGEFFYDIYKTISIAQEYMPVLLESGKVRDLVIEEFIDREILEDFDNFSPGRIMERAGGVRPGDLTEELRREVEALTNAMGTAIGEQIDSCYYQILTLSRFVSFDFETLIMFCFTDRGFNFYSAQEFESFKAERIIGLLQDFAEHCAVVDSFQDWEHVLGVLKTFRNGRDMINRKRWNAVRHKIREILGSELLVLIIQHITDDPGWSLQPSSLPRERIFSSWLADKRQTMEDAITRWVASHWTNRIAKLKQAIFGDFAAAPLKHYNEEASALFVAKGFEGFIHAGALACLLAFLREVFIKEIQEFRDLLIIRAWWILPSLSLPFGEAYQALESLMKRLDDFDESLGNGGINGSLLFIALARLEWDRSQGRFIRELLEKVNNEAMGILEQTAENLVNLADQVEAVKKDYAETPHTLIANWHEIEPASGLNMAHWLRGIADKLSKYIELTLLFIGKREKSRAAVEVRGPYGMSPQGK